MDGEAVNHELAKITTDEEMLNWVSQVTIDEFIHNCLTRELHPRDAASEMGMEYAIFVAAQHKFPELEPCWDNLDRRPKGGKPLTSQQMRSGQQIKDQLRNRVWNRFEGKLLRMIDRIPDDAEGDETVMMLLRNRIISDTLPREQVQKIDHTQINVSDFENMSDDDLMELYEKRHGKLVEFEHKTQVAKVINAENTAKNQERDAS